jgi:hypothetical protein
MKTKFLISILLLIAVAVSAQLPTVSTKIKNVGASKQGEYISFNKNLTDTLKSGDTLFYKFEITHTNEINPYVVQNWKLIAADTTVTVTFWQSMDGITTASRSWIQIYNTTTLPVTTSAYAKSVTATSANTVNYDFGQDMAFLSSRYLGIRYIAKTKTGFKSIPYGTVKNNIK